MKLKLFFILFCSIVMGACVQNAGDSGSTDSGGNGSAGTSSTEGELTLQLPNKFNNANLALSTAYATAAGNTVTLNEVRYWVSDVKLIKADTSETVVPESYYLMSQNNAATGDTTGERVPNFNLAAGNRQSVQLKRVPGGQYTGIKFSVGVPSTYNNDLSLRAGELHLYAHMANISWSWVTSYIFGKTSGTCTSCSGQQNFALEFGTNSNYKTVSFTFGSPITVSQTDTPTVNVKVDVEKFFTGIDVGTVSVDSTITKRAINGFNNAGQMSTVATNIASAFTLVSATNAANAAPTTGTTVLNFNKNWNGVAFALNTNYTDAQSNTVSIDHIRQYISNVILVKADNSEYNVPNSYLLISENGTLSDGNINATVAAGAKNSATFREIPAGSYKAIKFSVGVDSTYNGNLALQAGDLHLYSIMPGSYTWMWLTSYLFTKMGGQCVSCASNKPFNWDTGSNAQYRTITTALNFPSTVALASGKTLTIDLGVNLAKIFDAGTGGVNIATVTVVSSKRPINASSNSSLMTNVSDTYRDRVFSVSAASSN